MRNKEFKKIMKIISTAVDSQTTFTEVQRNKMLEILNAGCDGDTDTKTLKVYKSLIDKISLISDSDAYSITMMRALTKSVLGIKYPFMRMTPVNREQ